MDIVNSVTSSLLAKALDVAQLQHSLIANNIANVETEGFRPYRLDFQTLIQDLEALVNAPIGKEAALEQLKAFDTHAYVNAEEAGARVMLDQEMVALTKNTVHYQALLTAKSKLGSLMKTAIGGGR